MRSLLVRLLSGVKPRFSSRAPPGRRARRGGVPELAPSSPAPGCGRCHLWPQERAPARPPLPSPASSRADSPGSLKMSPSSGIRPMDRLCGGAPRERLCLSKSSHPEGQSVPPEAVALSPGHSVWCPFLRPRLPLPSGAWEMDAGPMCCSGECRVGTLTLLRLLGPGPRGTQGAEAGGRGLSMGHHPCGGSVRPRGAPPQSPGLAGCGRVRRARRAARTGGRGRKDGWADRAWCPPGLRRPDHELQLGLQDSEDVGPRPWVTATADSRPKRLGSPVRLTWRTLTFPTAFLGGTAGPHARPEASDRPCILYPQRPRPILPQTRAPWPRSPPPR
ncbi:translation initiation factor IF-2-like [Sciurus carolinensis]|uniref:translation initiation factor IF-2-like n=1 Tax=Sciurus carolinensis TaxID=30640 RepID=UPI001FB3964A|nr:translation initiation factor IF-2-like [Sciurus carolinensis]XP_047417969.1 translation initiation factor IF-2-like [Sciurus carolinensis]XP_047418481.1 translation initiation factor IF-2-like [Sciurus carolinensis]XP_047419021.1 translation initiation factor IF-2-like [Sciurus carolinensis]